ncbi:MAG: aldehyde ferredoxin oxidoreductase family protein [Anaerolineae bacterium]|nr:aldehyde ferredoxin oxidoreductase family protein [Anaerolineae bacterium]
MSHGFFNRILRVDLLRREVSIETPGEHFFRTYLGGWGLIAYYLLKELAPGIDPLSPENILIFAPGVVTGASLGGSGRNAVGAKSPLTGGFGEADVGGFWGAELKRAGWDAVIVTGKADTPVYLWIKDDEIEIRDAAHVWGKSTLDVEAMLKEELDEKRLRVAQCGVAGENQVRFACVINDVNRAAGRTGMGAVMGSKNLKAIAVRGTGRFEPADAGKIRETAKWLSDNVRTLYTGGMQDYGTAGGLQYLSSISGLPTFNFQEGSFEGAQKLTGATMADTILVRNDTCYACPVRCKRVVASDGAYKVEPEYGGPEYETLGALGSCCGVDNLEAVAYANQLCNAYGLDTISTGMTIAWAMECFERGLLTTADTGGLDLHFGNTEAMVRLVEQIARREGFGNLLAEGSLHAARKIGRGTDKYAMQVKGQEFPMHEPRVKFALNLGYATSPTGGDHMHNIHDTDYTRSVEGMWPLGIFEPLPADDLSPQKVRLAKYHIDWQVFWNCVGLCMFMPYSKAQIRDIVNAVTGWNTSLFELLKVGERAMAMARVFNAREGFTANDDVAHWRFATPFTSGPAEGVRIPDETMEAALALYYEMRGWDRVSGAPTRAKLYELGLDWVVGLL